MSENHNEVKGQQQQEPVHRHHHSAAAAAATALYGNQAAAVAGGGNTTSNNIHVQPEQDHHHHHQHQHHHQATSHHSIPVRMQNMHLPGQIDDINMQHHPDTQIHSGDAAAVTHMHMHSAPQADHGHALHHNNESGIDDDDQEEGATSEGMDGDVPADVGDQMAVIPPRSQGSNQLTLSFQGEVYVFDSVSPEKVQAVLLLLGGREMPPGLPTMPLSGHQHYRGYSDIPQRMNYPQRMQSLNRFREKRKERNFDKKIRYTVRKEVALRMQRNKGQFTSSKTINDEASSAVKNWDAAAQAWAQDGHEPQEAACRHCGISEKSTPMMRRGPAGPRTLCNACGLMWANKGTLRDLSKSSVIPGSNPSTSSDQVLAITADGHNSS